jgi:hypothetical protein
LNDEWLKVYTTNKEKLNKQKKEFKESIVEKIHYKEANAEKIKKYREDIIEISRMKNFLR